MKKLTNWLAIMLCLFIGFSIAYAGSSKEKPTTSETIKKRIILLHGLFGHGNSFMGGPYFPGLPDWIHEQTGLYPVIPNLGTGNLEDQYKIAIEAMQENCSDCRWHIVGHSRGGLVLRMVMTRHPEMVASVTTDGSPHRGCPVCDMVSSNPNLTAFLAIFGTKETAQIIEMSQRNMEKFNSEFPQGVPDGVKLCSQFRQSPDKDFKSTLTVEGREIQAASFVGNRNGPTGQEFDAFWYNVFDPTYYGNRLFGAATSGNLHYSQENDGVVPTCSAGFGKTGSEGMVFLAVDHNDLVNQMVEMAYPPGYEMLKAHILWVWNKAP